MRSTTTRVTLVLLVVLGLLAVLTSSLLPNLPVLAGGLLAAGAALGSWLGWQVGISRRPRVAPVRVESRRRRRPTR